MSTINAIDTREAKLARHWREKVNIDESDFDRMLEIRTCRVINTENRVGDTFNKIVHEIVIEISKGLPLYYGEFHVALAVGLLLTEMPYEIYFKTYWHERPTHRGYSPGGPRHCMLCSLDAREKGAATRKANRARLAVPSLQDRGGIS